MTKSFWSIKAKKYLILGGSQIACALLSKKDQFRYGALDYQLKGVKRMREGIDNNLYNG